MADKKSGTFLGLPASGRIAVFRLLKDTMPQRMRLYIVALLCMVGVAAFTGALAYSTKLIVNDVFVEGQASKAYSVAALVIFISLAKSFFQYFNTVILLRFTRSISTQFKARVFDKMIDSKVRNTTKEHSATHMNFIKIYSGSSGIVVVNITQKLLTDILTLLALVAVMIFQDPLMSLMAAVMFPTIFWMVGKLTRRIRELSSAEAGLDGAVYAIGAESVEGIKTVKSYGLEEKSKSRFAVAVETLEARLLRIGKTTALMVPIMESLGGLVIGFFVIYASWQTIENGKTPGEFTAFITAFLLAYQPAERISKGWIAIQRNIVQVERMYTFLDRPVEQYEKNSEHLKGADSSLEFEQVGFEYTKGNAALNNINYLLKPGENIAVVGRSGAGKTTMVDLILGFCEPSVGAIKMGGIDTKIVANNEVRRHVALISQDVFLFDSSIGENILDGNRNLTKAELVDVAKRASLSDLGNSIEEVLAMPVGPGGNKLSGGQKQRVAIARAFAKRAKIYVFDEATSALDGDNDREIMKSAVNFAKDSTMLFITHRAATLKWVDKVMFLEAGNIVAFDTHEKLNKTNERYRSLFDLAGDA